MAELQIGRIVLGSCATNCYYIHKEGKTETVVIDPADRGTYIYEKIKEKGLSVAAVLLTHGHFDHILGVKELQAATGAKTYLLKEEVPLSSDPEKNLSGWTGTQVSLVPDVEVSDGEELTLAGIIFKVLATPGHTDGSCCYYLKEDGVVFCGDTVFLESVGRTDFPTGSGSKLLNSVREKIFTLPDDVKLYPGHGDATSVEHEKRYNPFF